jgi:hypothetical protein
VQLLDVLRGPTGGRVMGGDQARFQQGFGGTNRDEQTMHLGTLVQDACARRIFGNAPSELFKEIMQQIRQRRSRRVPFVERRKTKCPLFLEQ